MKWLQSTLFNSQALMVDALLQLLQKFPVNWLREFGV